MTQYINAIFGSFVVSQSQWKTLSNIYQLIYLMISIYLIPTQTKTILFSIKGQPPRHNGVLCCCYRLKTKM